jgi:uncharacterized protein (TIGR02001 family)
MKKTLVALSLAAMTLPALAQDKKAPEPDYTITGNFGLFSDYRFRGISQTAEKPALQGGFDFAHKSGVYLGTWASNVGTWANLGGSMEIDFYGGFKGSLPMDVGFDIGAIAYEYPGNTPNPSNKTKEWYLGFSKGPLSYKYSRTTGNWFGIARSSGSNYHDLTATFPVSEKVSLAIHAGKQDITGSSQTVNPDYNDYSIGLSLDLGNSLTAGLKYTTVDFKNSGAKGTNGWFNTAATPGSPANKPLGDDAIVLSIVKTF